MAGVGRGGLQFPRCLQYVVFPGASFPLFQVPSLIAQERPEGLIVVGAGQVVIYAPELLIGDLACKPATRDHC